MKIKSIVFAFLLFCFMMAGSISSYSQMISPGEDITYEVSFLGVGFGSIRMVTESYTTFEGKQAVKAKCYMDSYKGIPFVSLHAVFDSWFDQSVSYSYKFESHMKENDYWLYDQIYFNHAKKQIEVEKWKKKDKYFGNIIKTDKKYVDGLTIFFLARQYLRSKKNVRIPTLIDKDIASTVINFVGSKANVEIDNCSYPIKTIYFNGKTEWTGIYGLNGTFEGWFSDDAAAVPIKAKLSVYIGSINVELKKWKRSGWAPPKG